MTEEANFPHPGETLKEFMFGSMELIVALGIIECINTDVIEKIIEGEEPITPDISDKFARFFDTTPEYWLNLQAEYDRRKQLNHTST